MRNSIVRYVYQKNNFFFNYLRTACKILNIGQFDKQVYERKEKSKYKKVKKDIEMCKEEGAEYIICMLHIGGQYNNEPTALTKEICDLCLKFGADSIIANHEHVIHPLKSEKKFCIYSLGNLLAPTGILEEPYDKLSQYSVGINLDIKKKNGKIFTKYSFKIFTSFLDKDGIIKCRSVKSLVDEIDDCDCKKKIEEECQILLNRIYGTQNVLYSLEEEYDIE